MWEAISLRRRRRRTRDINKEMGVVAKVVS
jgi:hypothetical protein